MQVEVNNFRLRWTTNSTGNAILIKATLTDADDAFLDSVTCVANDDGEYQVDASHWTNWQADANLIVQLGRYVDGTETMPLSNAEFRVGGVYWTVSKGKTR